MDNLARAGSEVASTFDKIHPTYASSPPSIHIDVPLYAEYQRYQLWASSLGIQARGHASLDYRLANAPKVRALVFDLLEELVLTLKQILEVGSGQRRPFDEAVEKPQPTRIVISLGNANSDDESDPSTSGDDDNNDDDDNDNDNDVTSNQTLTRPHQPSELAVRSEAAKDIINKLFGLAFKIRSPSKRQTVRDPLEKTDPAINAYMLDAEKLRLDDLVRHMQSQYRKQPMSEIVLSDPETMNIIDRFARANLRRRQLFLHWQRQSKSASSSTSLTSPGEAQEPISLPLQSQTLPHRPVLQHSMKTSQRTPATQLVEDNFFAPGPLSTKSHVTRTPTAHVMLDDDDDDDLEWPECPTELSDGDFKCPYCMHLCPNEYRRPAAWKSHLVHDVRPYVCSYPDCDDDHVTFDSHKDWTQHEISVHELRWTCADHGDHLYTPKQYQEHLAQGHNNTFQANARHGQTENPESEAVRLSERICPLCTAFFDDMAKMRSHMQHHLEKIALFTLPRSTGLEKISEDGSVQSRAAGAAKDHSRDGDFDGQLTAFTEHDHLASQHELACDYETAWQIQEAVQVLERIAKADQQTLAEKHPDRLAFQRELARACIRTGQIQNAVQLLEHVVKLMEQTLAETHPDRLASQQELAHTYRLEGRWAEAERLEVQVLERTKMKLGKNHLNTLTSMHNLASTLCSQGRWDEAEQLYVQVIEARKRVLGQDHPDTLSTMHNLAINFICKSKKGEAIELMKECVDIQIRVLGPDHPSTKGSQAKLDNWFGGDRVRISADISSIKFGGL